MRSPSKAGAVGHRDRHLGDLDLAAAHLERLLHDRSRGTARPRARRCRRRWAGSAGCRCRRWSGSRSRWRRRRRRISPRSLRPAPARRRRCGSCCTSGCARSRRASRRRSTAPPGWRSPGRRSAADMSLPKGTSRVSQPSCTPSSANCSAKVLAVGVAGHEDVEVLLLQLPGDLHRGLVRRGGAGHGGETRGRAIDKLDAALAHDHVVGRAEPDAVCTGFGPIRYLQASMISQANSAATPASRALPR